MNRPNMGLNHFVNWFMAIDNILRAARKVWDRCVRGIDADVVIHGGEHFAEMDRPFNGFSTEPVRCSQSLASFHAATREQSAGNARPMIATRFLVNNRGPAEFSPDNHGHI